MSDWRRKHFAELAHICRVCATDSSLTPEVRLRLIDAYYLAKSAATVPGGGTDRSAAGVITAFCKACQQLYAPACPGRSHWQDPCRLIEDPGAIRCHIAYMPAAAAKSR